MRKKIFGLLGALSFAVGLAQAIEFKTIESPGVYKVFSSRTSSISTHVAVGYGLAWSVYAVGGTADFEVKYSSITNGDPDVNRSSTSYALQGVPMGGPFTAIVLNPTIYISRIDAATTVYIDIPHLEPRSPGFQF